MIYGYARVSTKKQNIERQIRNIKSEYPSAIILQDEYTGTTLARPLWDKLMKNIREGVLSEVLFVGTGALMSPLVLNQGSTIPGIGHLVRITGERIGK